MPQLDTSVYSFLQVLFFGILTILYWYNGALNILRIYKSSEWDYLRQMESIIQHRVIRTTNSLSYDRLIADHTINWFIIKGWSMPGMEYILHGMYSKGHFDNKFDIDVNMYRLFNEVLQKQKYAWRSSWADNYEAFFEGKKRKPILLKHLFKYELAITRRYITSTKPVRIPRIKKYFGVKKQKSNPFKASSDVTTYDLRSVSRLWEHTAQQQAYEDVMLILVAKDLKARKDIKDMEQKIINGNNKILELLKSKRDWRIRHKFEYLWLTTKYKHIREVIKLKDRIAIDKRYEKQIPLWMD